MHLRPSGYAYLQTVGNDERLLLGQKDLVSLIYNEEVLRTLLHELITRDCIHGIHVAKFQLSPIDSYHL